MKKKISFILSLSMVITPLLPNIAFAEGEPQLGDYIRLGSYNGNEIIWRYVGSDENGRLMLSDEIICYKAFDAGGEHKYYTGSHSSYGSNLWSESNIRCWLNSETDQVDFICGVPPIEENVWLHMNAYDSEKGFLTGFSNDEKKAIKTVSIKTKLNPSYIEFSEGELDFPVLSINGDITMQTCNYQTTADRLFLLDEIQLNMVKGNFDDNYYAKTDAIGDTKYSIADSNTADRVFLRSPNLYEEAAYSVCTTIKTDKTVLFGNTTPANMVCAIRPAFYLSEDTDFIRGDGTKKDPYIISDNVIYTDVLENDTKTLLVVNDDELKLYDNGSEILFTDAKPFIDENDRTQIPIRAVSESLGYNVEYDDENKIVTISDGSTNIKLIIGDRYITVNDEAIEMDTSAQLVNDRTYIPIRFVAEALGYTVNYSAPITGWTIDENGVIVLKTEEGLYDDIKDRY